jgi:hypothetical protein
LGRAEKILGELERMTGMTASPLVRAYPSREAFRDATGIVAPVQGVTRGGTVRLPPWASDATLRHELLHAVLETNTRANHPRWFREGLVLSLLNEAGAEKLRTDRLIARHGRSEVLAFWRTGLPANEVQ